MIFIGFGFLMTFLRKYGYSSVGITMLIAAMILQWNPLLEAFFHGVFTGTYSFVEFHVATLIESDFSAAAVLITFGALIGKVSPLQMSVIAILEPIFYNINYQIALLMNISDIGGSMIIHTFGAFFGLAATRYLSSVNAVSADDNAAIYHSDLFAMVGTIFLWLFWPSFNGAFALEDSFTRAIVNTLISLTGSCVASFLFSYVLRGETKFWYILNNEVWSIFKTLRLLVALQSVLAQTCQSA